MTAAPKILVTDFDGTLAAADFYKLVWERLVPPGTPHPWADYQAGKISHFEAMNAVFAAAEPGEPRLLDIVEAMGLDPDLPDSLGALRAAGWEVVVASAGCRWYIDRLLTAAGVEMEVHANHGGPVGGRLVMELPHSDPYFEPETGIDKAGVVRRALERGGTVAFAGDGPPDVAPSLLVPPERRFATGHLAEELEKRGERFRRFGRWSEVAAALAGGG